jgi:predicted enzyme related to lactoylglutathione lyase
LHPTTAPLGAPFFLGLPLGHHGGVKSTREGGPVSDLNSKHNRLVWFDIPVADLDRAAAFYRAVLGIMVHREKFGDVAFCVLDHKDGNGGCLVHEPDHVSQGGILCYLNVDGRIRDAVSQAGKLGGRVLEAIHPIGPHGYRALLLDSEGNRVALHSTVDQ